MKQTRLIMGMPITVQVVDGQSIDAAIGAVFDYFVAVDERYSTYKSTSEISKINHGLARSKWSDEMCRVLELCEQTRQQTQGFFNIKRSDGTLDPSGLVKGWAIHNASHLLLRRGIKNYCIEAGGDIQAHGRSPEDEAWEIGLRNPFATDQVIKIIRLRDDAVATSGTYIRGQHIYNPQAGYAEIHDTVSLTVIGPNIYDADRFATAAFAMGKKGIAFIESLPALEGYMVDATKTATYTSGFQRYVKDVPLA